MVNAWGRSVWRGRPVRSCGRSAEAATAWQTGRAAGAILLCALVLGGCTSPPVEVVESRLSMDTEVTVRAIAPSEAVARRAVEAAWKEMDTCVLLLDRYRKPSEAWLKGDPAARRDPAQRPSDVWRINQDAGKWATQVDPIVTSCLAAAKEVWDASGGAFDPTVGPLVDLWRRAAAANRLPTDEEVAKARALVGMDKVEIMAAMVVKRPQDMPLLPPGEGDRKPQDMIQPVHSVGIRPGMQLDLGGVAKGYIAGRMARRMDQAGAVAGLVATAGDIYAFGEKPASLVKPSGDRRWSVGVQDPRFPDERTRLYTSIHVRDQGVDTSGHYYRGFIIEGKRYSHVLDPRTGRPVDTRLASITVVSDDPAVGDAMATAIAVMGVKDGLAMVEKTDGVECLVLEVRLKEGQALQPNGAPPPEAELIAHRSKGFQAMEFVAAEVKPAE